MRLDKYLKVYRIKRCAASAELRSTVSGPEHLVVAIGGVWGVKFGNSSLTTVKIVSLGEHVPKDKTSGHYICSN
jgi:ribosomal 50S subunit-recycling heat shock protein